MSIPIAFPALQHRNFRLFWIGQGLSLPGSMMQNTAVLWHVSVLAGEGNKALALGMVGMARLLPILALSMLGGLVADAWDRRKLMLGAQVAMALVATAIAVVSFLGADSLALIYVLTGLSSAAAAVDGPARSSLVPALVSRENLANAVSLNTTLFQLASVAGPALAGLSLVWLPVGWVYAINAASFAGIIGALLRMRELPPRPASERSKVDLCAIREGLRFVFTTPLIRSTTLLDFNAAVFATATALLPIFAQDILQVGPAGFGWLCAAPSLGAVIASGFMVRYERRIERRGAALIASVAAYGAATVAFGLSTHFAAMLFCLALIGASDTVNMVLRNVIRQLHTPDHLRGRMSGINVMFAKGGPELGELEAGLVAHSVGAPLSVVLGGVGSLAATAWIAWQTPALRLYGWPRRARFAPALRSFPTGTISVPVAGGGALYEHTVRRATSRAG